MATELVLIEKQYFEVDKATTLRQYIQTLNLSTIKEHLRYPEYEKILKWIQGKRENGKSSLDGHRGDYFKIVKAFPKLEDWENEDFPKLDKQRGKNYLWVLSLCGRVQVGWHHFASGDSLLPDILSEQQELRIVRAVQELNYASDYGKRIRSGFLHIVVVKQKEFEEINSNDILEYCTQSLYKNRSARAFFNVGKKLFDFPEEWESRQGVSLKKDRTVGLPPAMKDEYEYFQRNEGNPTSRVSTQYFCEFLVQEYPEIEEYNDIEPDHLKAYALKLRRASPPLADRTYNGYVGRIRKFLLFVSLKKKICKSLIVYLGGEKTKGQFNELFGDASTILPLPVQLEDRELIEQLIYSYSPSTKYEYICISAVKLIYHTALRPNEARCLRLDCIRGTKEIRHLHVHRAKFYKERYLPLIQEVQSLIEELQKYNRGTLPYYNSWDAETTKRLFAVNGEQIGSNTINKFFSRLLASGGLIDEDGNSKYSLYILRKIRITTWLESGLTDIEVAELVGHGDLENLKFYLVGKENRMKNARKVYDTYYKNAHAELIATGTYEIHQQTQKQDEVIFIENLKKSLTQIENKGINRFVIDEVLKQCPELVMPVPCGGCLAIALLGTEVVCEKLKLPCLECKDLKVMDNHIGIFDEFATRLYKAVDLTLKNNVHGLTERNLALISRLKKFYVARFGIAHEEVEARFLKLSPGTTRRGRKPKEV